ncbi:hypothetical protein PPUJ20005_03830 [Pseudomonas putida]|uniref:hypothetical protein n=1 Tax=Pseudomonas putida TaxID=303 RepID=UPI00235D586B|nr:hypothetical protein [Pseudomonas putida]GLO06415.1 hypothetical protein PPUJ20005_03830 [Pseudomonas putida]HDS0986119.1 hypothetical protein [Pseudomonas putida]
METDNQVSNIIQALYESQLVLTTEYILEKIGLPVSSIQKLLEVMDKKEMQDFLDNHARLMQVQLLV